MTITSVGRRHRGLAAGLARAPSRACARRIDGTWTGFVHGYYTETANKLSLQARVAIKCLKPGAARRTSSAYRLA